MKSQLFNNKTATLKTLSVLILLSIFNFQRLNASNPTEAEQVALSFFNSRAKAKIANQSAQKSVPSSLSLKYISSEEVETPVYAFEKQGEGFVLVSEDTSGHSIVGYAESRFVADSIPPALSRLISLYEKNLLAAPKENKVKMTAVAPLLDAAGVSLNQFYHENAGNCPTGCVATAMTQIMAYHKYPQKGKGSHCYTHSVHGELCADFEKTTYNWNNPTDEDYKLLSFHVGVGMDMNYCGDKYGSVPGSANYRNTLSDYFKYHLIHSNRLEYILNEIEKDRPVYCEFPGNPGHSVVLDGYDENGLIHVNFGWGGKWNGYYLLNTNDYIVVDYLFGSNIMNSVFISPKAYKTIPSDSLALVALNNSLNGTTGWNLSTPVYQWSGVLVINERVVELVFNIYQSRNVQGSISSEIEKLTALKSLDIQGVLTGNLPDVSKLTELEYLNIDRGLQGGTLTGTLSEEINKLSKIKHISLKNILTGNLPASLGQLKELNVLDLAGGSLTGSIPDEICNLPKLKTLNLSGHQLSGNLPKDIGNLKSLNYLNLSVNKLSGLIPESLGNLDSLNYFSISNNQYTGVIPDIFTGCTKLETALLNNNQFTGDVPLSLINKTSKLSLDVSNNKLSRIPDSINNQSKIERLVISENKFKTLPLTMNNLGSLKILYANNNQIDSLPEGFGFISSLDSLNISHNLLNKFPEGICYIPTLISLVLNNNKITRFPYSINSLSTKLKTLTLDSNEIRGPIPASLLLKPFTHFLIHHNRLRYEDIPDTTGIVQYVGNQKKIELSKQVYPVTLGDTVRIDIRKIAPVFHPGNKYYWCRYPKYTEGWDIYKAMDNEKEGPVLEIVIDKININYTYYCKIFNPSSPKYTSLQWGITDKCLPYLDTDTISFRIGSEQEILKNKYPELYVTGSENLPESTVQDGTVTLFSNQKVRGTLVWQASADAKNWVDITSNMTNEALKANIQSISEKEIILKPASTAWYRTKIVESSCDPVYGDTIKVNAPGTVLYDKTINVTKDSIIIDVDSIEIYVPKGFHEKDFRLTIVKLDKAPGTIPKEGKLNSVYDVSVSFGNEFKIPLIIKLKNIPPEMLLDSVLPNVGAYYFNDVNRKWLRYDNQNIIIKENSLQFYTYHLTKITSGYLYRIGYTHFLQGKRVKVVYTSDSTDYMLYYGTYYNNNRPFIGYMSDDVTQGGHPMMIQDIAIIADTSIVRLERHGLVFPEIFTIYVSALSSSAGSFSIYGQFCGYLTINPNAQENVFRSGLKMTIPHELMHYLQDEYMVTALNNTFWMETNAPLASRIVYTESELPDSESEYLIKENRRTVQFSSILDLLALSWDYQDRAFILEKFLTSQADANLSSTFLYYMQQYRPGSKLDPVKLLTEHGWINSALNWIWRTYLDSQIKKQISSTAGDEFDAFVKYIISGTNKNFCISDSTGNPYQYYIENAMQKSWSESIWGDDFEGTFLNRFFYKFNKEDIEAKTENVSISIPHLAAKMVMIENHDDYRGLAVEYKRKHSANKDLKIYHGWYDVKTKTMKLTDISDSAKYNFMISKKSMKHPQEYQEYAFLLLVNKFCPPYDDKYLETERTGVFDLTIRPILDIESLEFLGFGDETMTTYVQLYDNGSNDQVFYFNGTNRAFRNSSHYSTEKKMLNDSVIRIDVENNYYYEHKLKLMSDGPYIGYEPPQRGNIRITQVIHYNIYKNTVKIEEIESGSTTIQNHKHPLRENTYVRTYLDAQWIERKEIEIEIELPEDIGMISETNDDYTFKTHTSEETKSILLKANHYVERKDYTENGNMTHNISNLVNTDYSQGTVKIWGRFRAEKPEVVIVSNP